MNVICKEPILKQGKPQTYQQCSLSSSDTVRKHLDHVDTYRFLQICITFLIFTGCLKLHKDPYGNRFIAVSNASTTKPFSRLLIACLTSILQE